MQATPTLRSIAAALVLSGVTAAAGAQNNDDRRGDDGFGNARQVQDQALERGDNGRHNGRFRENNRRNRTVSVPEPSTNLLLGIALVLLGVVGLRKRKT